MDIELLLKTILVLSASFALVGLAVALIRLINKATETLDEVKMTNHKVNTLADKFTNDYGYISSSIRGLSDTVDILNQSVIDPVRNLSRVVKTVELFSKNLVGRFKGNTKTDEADYLPEEEY